MVIEFARPYYNELPILVEKDNKRPDLDQKAKEVYLYVFTNQYWPSEAIGFVNDVPLEEGIYFWSLLYRLKPAVNFWKRNGMNPFRRR